MESIRSARVALLFVGLGTLGAACSANVILSGDCTVDGNSYEVGATFTASDGCNQCTCQDGGSVTCTEFDCSNGCVYQGAFHNVGDTFDAGDGCNACSCDGPNQVNCSQEACGCKDEPPVCEQPGSPDCNAFPQCDGVSWTCVVDCSGCEDAPPIDCKSPPGCFYDGPICIDGQWSCGDLVCDECAGDPPACPQPKDPNCYSQAVCSDFGWECEIFCDKGTCEDMYPEGYQTVLGLIVQHCACDGGAPCEATCGGTQYCGGPGDPDDCGQCIQGELDMQGQCVVDAALGDECQSDPECASYVQCVISGG